MMPALKREETVTYSLNSFFAGIGGFDLGFEKAGMQPALQCEIDEFCHAILERHWPDVPRVRDIRDVDRTQIPVAHVWCGGFPCQDVSVARGRLGREGLQGSRSGLFFPFLELVRECLPPIVVLENVTGLLNSHRGQDYRIILEELTALDYGVAWRVLNTRYFGAPQSRSRVFIVGWRLNPSLAAQVLFEEKKAARPRGVRSGFVTPADTNGTGVRVPQVAYCLAATSGRHTGTDWSRSYVAYERRVRRLTPEECERLQGFPYDWTLPPEEAGYDVEDIDSLRYQALGNAVSVPVVSWLGNRIASLLASPLSLGQEPTHSEPLGQILAESSAEFEEADAAESMEAIKQRDKIRWCKGGVAWRGEVVPVSASPAPVSPVESSFANVVTGDVSEDRYYLSPNAARGIIRRVDGQGRSLFKPLRTALDRLATADR